MNSAAREADLIVMAAAVADYRPARRRPGKVRRGDQPMTLDLVPTPDILSEVSAARTNQVLVGFAAETRDLEDAGRGKLERKKLDLMVVNEVGREGTGFGSDTNNAMILSSAGDHEPLRIWTKRELARAVCDRVVKLLET